jgi:hypothetical protein
MPVRALAIDLGLFVLAVGAATLAYGLATPDSDVTLQNVLVNTAGNVALSLPCLAVYLGLLWAAAKLLPAAPARVAAVLLSPVAFAILFSGADVDDTSLGTTLLTIGLPALAYGLVVRSPSARAAARRQPRDTPRGRPRAA